MKFYIIQIKWNIWNINNITISKIYMKLFLIIYNRKETQRWKKKTSALYGLKTYTLLRGLLLFYAA